MKHAERNLIVVLILAFLCTVFAPATEAEGKPARLKRKPSADQEEATAPTETMTIWQARRAVVTGLTTVMPKMEFVWGAGYKVNLHPESIRISARSIECMADVSTWGFNTKPDPHTKGCGINLRAVGTLGVKRYRRQYQLTNGSRAGFELIEELAWATSDEAQEFAGAVNRLRSAARGEDLGVNQAVGPDFQQRAAVWRALPTKPAISEEVRKHRLLAEDSVKGKQFEAAVEEYEAGLANDPVWPEGHFNAALLCAELGYYSVAIQHMRAYVELVPEAQDAQQARDQMVIWEAKMKQ